VERDFWLERWELDQIGFHQSCVNPLLEAHWPGLGIPRHRGVLVPLCGKSLDMRYLERLGHRVWGVELSEKAIGAYFEESGESPEVTNGFYLTSHAGAATTLYCGDFFDLQAPDIRGVGAVYDRGALVALPPRQRAHYADHLQRVVPERSVMLLLTFEYDQSRVSGPPFSVGMEEIESLYSSRCSIIRLARDSVRAPPRFAEAGLKEVMECAYKIQKNR